MGADSRKGRRSSRPRRRGPRPRPDPTRSTDVPLQGHCPIWVGSGRGRGPRRRGLELRRPLPGVSTHRRPRGVLRRTGRHLRRRSATTETEDPLQLNREAHVTANTDWGASFASAGVDAMTPTTRSWCRGCSTPGPRCSSTRSASRRQPGARRGLRPGHGGPPRRGCGWARRAGHGLRSQPRHAGVARPRPPWRTPPRSPIASARPTSSRWPTKPSTSPCASRACSSSPIGWQPSARCAGPCSPAGGRG